MLDNISRIGSIDEIPSNLLTEKVCLKILANFGSAWVGFVIKAPENVLNEDIVVYWLLLNSGKISENILLISDSLKYKLNSFVKERIRRKSKKSG